MVVINSVKTTTRLHDKHEAFSLPILKFTQDWKTRWDNEYHMLDRLFVNKQVLNDNLTDKG